ncbi:hypothetical protein [Brevundimonas sp.]|uniref:hypothetical protein n=1 Tax=Brevundimonas sp. TaxID=1871086 RepID=UPI0025CC2DFE|nr:hypothetical protein [Brevundimonas sp.]
MRKRYVFMGLAGLCGSFFAFGVIAQPVGRVTFTIENDGHSDLAALHLSRPDAESWGNDRLSGAAIVAGDSGVVTLDPGLGGCHYDLRAEFDSGAERRLFRVDVCRLNGATLSLAD